jgi:hypothetical protein
MRYLVYTLHAYMQFLVFSVSTRLHTLDAYMQYLVSSVSTRLHTHTCGRVHVSSIQAV